MTKHLKDIPGFFVDIEQPTFVVGINETRRIFARLRRRPKIEQYIKCFRREEATLMSLGSVEIPLPLRRAIHMRLH